MKILRCFQNKIGDLEHADHGTFIKFRNFYLYPLKFIIDMFKKQFYWKNNSKVLILVIKNYVLHNFVLIIQFVFLQIKLQNRFQRLLASRVANKFR